MFCGDCSIYSTLWWGSRTASKSTASLSSLAKSSRILRSFSKLKKTIWINFEKLVERLVLPEGDDKIEVGVGEVWQFCIRFASSWLASKAFLRCGRKGWHQRRPVKWYTDTLCLIMKKHRIWYSDINDLKSEKTFDICKFGNSKPPQFLPGWLFALWLLFRWSILRWTLMLKANIRPFTAQISKS